ncbi:MAG: hypothetical protein V3U39_12310 [Acidimicrobiia bacterium]
MSMAEDQNALEAVAQLPRDMMLLKMENESIMAVARKEPRDAAKLISELQALIDAYPAAADDAIYSKPVGTVTEVTCGGCGIKYEVDKVFPDTACPDCESTKRGACRPVKKFAEGLSIRAAESIRTIFGYTRLATTCEILPDGSARLTGVLVDYVAGNITSDERVVSRHYKSRRGGMTTVPEDRFLNVVVKAEKAKLRRDVILDNTPGIVKAMFRDSCEQKMAAMISPEVIKQKILPAFGTYGITPKDLDAIIGSPAKLGWNKAQKLELRKILAALKNEETTPRELLEGMRQPAPAPAPAGGGVKPEDLMSQTHDPRGVGPAEAGLPTAPERPSDELPVASSGEWRDLPAEPTGPETAAQAPEMTVEQLEQAVAEHENSLLAEIRATKSITLTKEIEKDLDDSGLPDEHTERLHKACEQQRVAIRLKRATGTAPRE